MHEMRSLPQSRLPAPLTPLVGRERKRRTMTLLMRTDTLMRDKETRHG